MWQVIYTGNSQFVMVATVGKACKFVVVLFACFSAQ